ncbi:hypothetical protein ACV36C_39460, partial [Pseudomonas aeruginosa]
MKQKPVWFTGRTNATLRVGKCAFLFHEASGWAEKDRFSVDGKDESLVCRIALAANTRVSTGGR